MYIERAYVNENINANMGISTKSSRGIARVVHDLSHRLIKDGHEVTVVTYKEGNVEDCEDDNGVKVYRVNNYMINPNNFIDWIMQLNFNLISKATELISKEGPFDVIHAHDWLVAYAAKTLKILSKYQS